MPRLRGLEPGEVGLLLQAPLALPLAALALRRWGLNRVLQRITARPLGPVSGTHAERLAAARRLTWCVQVAAAYSPWLANCLHRSVTLCWFLRRRGLEGALRIGVRRDADGTMDFHAWVEYDGVVLNDREDVTERYAVFDRPIVPPRARFA